MRRALPIIVQDSLFITGNDPILNLLIIVSISNVTQSVHEVPDFLFSIYVSSGFKQFYHSQRNLQLTVKWFAMGPLP